MAVVTIRLSRHGLHGPGGRLRRITVSDVILEAPVRHVSSRQSSSMTDLGPYLSSLASGEVTTTVEGTEGDLCSKIMAPSDLPPS